ncbi:hypothetical protein FRC08_002566 [Ceratobasidium sp. 394]|nr:hypothetical protein FRC08_002566 [Ceratobasidium sp. 394]
MGTEKFAGYTDRATAQDASTMGALMQGKDSFDEERLKNAILRDLDDIHNISPEELAKEYEAMYPFDWNHNPKTMGAYASFGPGQFSSLYPNLARPAAENRLDVTGEAIRTCHAQVWFQLYKNVIQIYRTVDGLPGS